MKALVLVGGEGTRLRPLTYDLPKPLAPVLTIPYLGILFSYLSSYGVTEVVMACAYQSAKIEEFCSEWAYSEMKFDFSYEETPGGTGGGIKHAEASLKETFLVLNGDIVTNINLASLVRMHRERQARVTIATVEVPDPSAYGMVVSDSTGKIEKFVEKPSPATDALSAGDWQLPNPHITDPSGARRSSTHRLSAGDRDPAFFSRGGSVEPVQLSNQRVKGTRQPRLPGARQSTAWINAGIYVVEPEILSSIPPGVPTSVERETFPLLIEKKIPLFACRHPRAYWLDMGTPEKYHQVHRDLLTRKLEIPPLLQGYLEHPPGLWRGNGVEIDDRARIIPPVFLGSRSRIGKGAVVGPHAVLGEGALIGEEAEVSFSILWRGAVVREGAKVREGVLGESSLVPGGMELPPGTLLRSYQTA